MKNKFTAAITALMMVVALLPNTVFAAEHKHKECGKTACDTHTEDVTYTEIDSLTKSTVKQDGAYYLSDSCTGNEFETGEDVKNLKLCLNGKSWSSFDNGFSVLSKSSLTISDCQGGGKIVGPAKGSYTGITANGTVNLYDTEITDFTNGGVRVETGFFTGEGSGELNIAGNVKIIGNTSEGDSCNVSLSEDAYINVVDALGDDAKIGITSDAVASGDLPVKVVAGNGHLTEDDVDKFSSDNAICTFNFDGSDIYLDILFEGSGTTRNPYIIDDANSLAAFCNYINTGKGDKIHFKLTHDIDLEGKQQTTIGNTENPFKGTFDGDGHTISGFNINASSESGKGLFGSIGEGGTVKNLNLVGSITGKDNVGGIAGENHGSITNCHVNANVVGNSHIGGITGYNYGNITNCDVAGSINGDSNLGGIAGYSDHSITQSYSAASVSGNSHIGGVAGQNYGDITDCYNTGSVTGSIYVGGIAGYQFLGSMANCYSFGTVKGEIHSGGITGQNYADVSNCYFLAGTADSSVGGDEAKEKSEEEFKTLADALNGSDGSAWRDCSLFGRPQLYGNPEIVGMGTEDEPYLIPNLATLELMREYINVGRADGNYFELTGNIDMSDKYGSDIGGAAVSWTPLGNAEYPFNAVFNGGTHTISGLYINDKTGEGVGLFGYIGDDGTVKNLNVSGSVTGHKYVGGIAGENHGNISDCVGTVSVSGDNLYTGGIAGGNDGNITATSNGGAVTGKIAYTGGIAGNNTGAVSDCSNTGTVNGSVVTGGIVGENTGSIAGSYNTETVAGGDSTGGIAGENINEIANCFNAGGINGSGNLAGGITGENDGSISDSYNRGKITGGGGFAGAIAGYQKSGNISNCYFLADTADAGTVGSEDTSVEKTDKEFKSGEVAWLLQGSGDSLKWGQEIDTDDFPKPNPDAGEQVHRVLFVTEDNPQYKVCYVNTNNTVSMPENPTRDEYDFNRWSQTSSVDGDVFTAETRVTKDMTIYAVGRVYFDGEADTVIVSDVYGYETEPTLDLNTCVSYYGGVIDTIGRFDYEISDNGGIDVSIEGDTLVVPMNLDAGDYPIVITATERDPGYALMSVEEYGKEQITLNVTVKILKADPVFIKAPEDRPVFTYTGEPQKLVTDFELIGGEMHYLMYGEGNLSTEIPTATNAGIYQFSYRIVGDKNHNDDGPHLILATIEAVDLAGTVSPNELTYTGEAQELVSPGEITDGLLYSMEDDMGYSSEIPTGTDAGDYTVWYMVNEDDNHIRVYPTPVPVTIKKADMHAVLSVTPAEGLRYTGGAQPLITSGTSTEGELQYCTERDGEYSPEFPTGTNAGEYEIWYKAVGDKNHNDSEPQSITVSIAKAEPEAVVAANDLTYTGEAQALVTGNTNDGELRYSDIEDGAYSADVPTGTNAGEYEVWYKVLGDGNHNDSAPQSISVTIAKAEPKADVTANVLSYTGEAQELVTGNTNDGELRYSDIEDGAYSADVPTGTNAGEYEVWYKVLGDGNHNDSAPQSISVTIAKAEPKADVTANVLSYTGEAQELVTGSTDDGELRYSDTEDGTYSADIPTGVNASEYEVWYKVLGDENHNDSAPQSITVTIAKSEPKADVTANDLTYTGEVQELVTGSTDDGELRYCDTEDGAYSADVPTGTNAGEYEVWYKVLGDENHSDSEPQSITVTIAGAEPKADVTANDLTYTGEAQELVTGSTDDGELRYSDTENGEYSADIPTGVNGGEYEVWYKVLGDENHSDSAPQSITVTIAKIESEAVVTANVLSYTGEAQELVTGSTDDGELRYSDTEDGTYSADIPTGVNGGEYEVWYKVFGDENHNDSAPQSIKVTIAKIDPTVVVESARALYDDAEIPQALVKYEAPDGVTVMFSDKEDGQYTAAVPTGTKAGEYTLWYKVVGNENYNDLPPKSLTVKIAHGFAEVLTAPEAIKNLVYDGTAQSLVTPGVGMNGEMEYSLDGKTYSPDLPTGTEAGEYTVWYKVVGGYINDKHYHDSEAQSLTVVISRNGDYDYIIKSAGFDADGNLEVEILCQVANPSAAKLVAASYSGGVLTDIMLFDIDGATVDLDGYAPQAENVKLFIWSDLDYMVPLALPYEING